MHRVFLPGSIHIVTGPQTFPAPPIEYPTLTYYPHTRASAFVCKIVPGEVPVAMREWLYEHAIRYRTELFPNPWPRLCLVFAQVDEALAFKLRWC